MGQEIRLPQPQALALASVQVSRGVDHEWYQPEAVALPQTVHDG
jgi:hypothetical protein